jgi:hypothetical protein
MLENITLLSLLATVIILTVLAHVYFYFYLKTLRRQLDSQTYQLYFAATGKADLLPLAIERLKVHDPSYSFAGLIEARAATLSRSTFDEEKRRLEDALWQKYQALEDESESWPGVKQDHLLSAVGKQLKEAELNLERERENYNRLTGRYNKIAGNLLLKPAALAAGARKRTLF